MRSKGKRNLKSNKQFSAVFVPILLGLAVISGCDPISSEDKAFFEDHERERGQREASLRAASSAVREEDVISNVQRFKSPDGIGTMQDWLDRQIIELNGQILFPKWIARRRGSNIQEVTFNFILVDSRNLMRRIRYVWDVDVLDMTVGSPTLLELGEIDSPDQTLANQLERRVLEFEKQLQ